MSQLASNCNDPGKGRSMPVHYSGKDKVGIVSFVPHVLPWSFFGSQEIQLLIGNLTLGHHAVASTLGT